MDAEFTAFGTIDDRADARIAIATVQLRSRATQCGPNASDEAFGTTDNRHGFALRALGFANAGQPSGEVRLRGPGVRTSFQQDFANDSPPVVKQRAFPGGFGQVIDNAIYRRTLDALTASAGLDSRTARADTFEPCPTT